MKLSFLGGADEVGASSLLIEIAGKRLLVDAGIRISPRTWRGIAGDQLPDLHPASAGVDFILVTHAHTDHTGALPLVVEQFPHVPVLTTPPTVEIVRVLLADARKIMLSKQEAEGELPLFDDVAIERLMNAFQPVALRQPVSLGAGLQVTFHPAGHIIGAATLVFESAEGTLVVSGDLSLSDQRAVGRAAAPRLKADALVLESTYGGKLHANRAAEEKRLIASITQVIERGGRVLIPAFAVGRAQEIVQIILAHRDQFSAPVYVDGMVRSVCDAYTRLSDWLPPATVKAAGDEPLFFRRDVRPITSAAQREELARAAAPAVIIASSGMLTGGASSRYARFIAPEENSAIFLTGYQDEEAPGRFLQRLAADRQNGQATLKFGEQTVTVRCAIETYSLSAHADEAELTNLAEAFDPERIFLVHGDPNARNSVASRLRQRDRRVSLPQAGQTVELDFAPRPWALGQGETHEDSRPFDSAALWEKLRGQAEALFTTRELAQMWWGDAERAAEVLAALENDLYFAPDWQRRDRFRVRTLEQVERARRQQAVLTEHPDLPGKLVVLRDSNNRPRVGVVRALTASGFEAVVYETKGRQFPADSLLWVIGDAPPDVGSAGQIKPLVEQADRLRDTLLPFENRQQVAAAGLPVNPADLLPPALPVGVTPDVALLSVVMALAADGATRENGGLLLRRARAGEPLEQNAAREVALQSFPAEARLRKVGLEIHRRRLTLTFDFPETAQRLYADLLERVADQTGWEVRVTPATNQQALIAVISELLPDARIIKGPSLYLNERETHITVDGVGDTRNAERVYLDLTGFKLVVRRSSEAAAPAPSPAQVKVGERLEINAAYALIRQALEPCGLYKAGLKGSDIVLTFISPQVGQRHQEIIARLAEQTGYPLVVHPHPNQQDILRIAGDLFRAAGWVIRKGPGIHTDRAEVSVSLAQPPDAEAYQTVWKELEAKTGYKLVVG